MGDGRRLVACIVGLVVLLVGCSSGSEGASTASTASTAVETTTTVAASTTTLVAFAGPGDFYDAPKPLPAGEPGALIRFEQVDKPDVTDRTVWRVMYHSRDAQDHDVAVTGLVSVPTAAAPAGGWPVLSWGHGTTGLAPDCAPSRAAGNLPAFGTDGILVGSDYVGLGPNGQRHAYLSGTSEGHSVIDIVRAAAQIPGVSASKRWTTVGISEGGHAVLFASELAATYAPELDLLGTVAMAPGSELDRRFPADNPQLISLIEAMAVYGLAVDHPQIHPEEYATPELQAAFETLEHGCVEAIASALGSIPKDKFWTVDPLTTALGQEVARQNNPGQVISKAPLLIVQGDKDAVAVPARTDALVERLCGNGQELELKVIPGADHDLKPPVVGETIAGWLQQRLGGEPATSTCP